MPAAVACPRRCWRSATGRSGSGAHWARCSPTPATSGAVFHKIANVHAALTKSAQPGAKKALAEIWNAEDKAHALTAVKAFENDYRAKFAKAVAKITDDLDALLAFYDYPAEHWIHLRTTNPIVIWSSFEGVVDVRHAASRSLVLRSGRGYLQLSRRHSLRRDDASCPGHLSGLVA
jgi:transposase-like protein